MKKAICLLILVVFLCGNIALADDRQKQVNYLEYGINSTAIDGYHWNGKYWFLRMGRDFNWLSVFGQASRDELGKIYGFGARIYLFKGFYVFHYQGQGIDNVDMINHEWVYAYPEELVIQHSHKGNGIGYCCSHKMWRLFVEYSRDSIRYGANTGAEWTESAQKINIGLAYLWF